MKAELSGAARPSDPDFSLCWQWHKLLLSFSKSHEANSYAKQQQIYELGKKVQCRSETTLLQLNPRQRLKYRVARHNNDYILIAR